MLLINISVVVLLVVAITEVILNASWSKFYFLYGIPLFRKKIEITDFVNASDRIKNF